MFGGLAWATSLTVKSYKGNAILSSRSLLGILPTLFVNAGVAGLLLWVLV
jgi:hypothetical protein